MDSTYETLLVETRDDVLTITFNRSDKLNAFNQQMTDDLMDVLKKAERDPSVRCLVITGTGRAFSSGQDLADLKDQYRPGVVPRLGGRLRKGYNPIVKRMRAMEKPIVAAVNGVAAGAGASLAFACDIRIASETAAFVEAFVNVGLVPDSGSTFFLPRLVGTGKAFEMCFTGDKVGAEQALHMGLVNYVVDPDALQMEAHAFASRLAKLPTKAIGLTKRLINEALTNSLDQQLEAEAYHQETAGMTEDHMEGVMSFLEKRPPEFKGK